LGSKGSRNHHLRDQGIIISGIKGLSFQVSRDQKMNLKDLVMNVKDQELIILGIMGSSSLESRDHYLRKQGIIILLIKELSSQG